MWPMQTWPAQTERIRGVLRSAVARGKDNTLVCSVVWRATEDLNLARRLLPGRCRGEPASPKRNRPARETGRAFHLRGVLGSACQPINEIADPPAEFSRP